MAAVRFEAVFYNDLCVCRDRNVGFQRQNEELGYLNYIELL